MNFDELAEFQRKLHREEDYYSLFIKLDAVTNEEAEKLWEWMMEQSLDVDRQGDLRKKLLPRLKPCFVASSLIQKPGGRQRVIPESLRLAIELFLLS
jgi:hypothetical protein